MAINWKTIEKDGAPKSHFENIETPFITCVVWVANPKALNGGIPRVCQWNVAKQKWEDDSIIREFNWFEIRITHYCDDYNYPEN